MGTPAVQIAFLLAMLTGLAFTVFNDPYIRRVHRRALLAVVVLCAALVLQNQVESLLAAGAPRVTARTLAAILGYCLRPAVIALFISIVSPGGGRRLWALVLLGINALVHLTALFSGLCFSISPDNHFIRGPLGYTCLAVSLALLLQLLFITIRYRRRGPVRELALPVLIVGMILAATWLDLSAGETDFPISCLTAAMALSCVFYYIWLHGQFVREHEEDLRDRQQVRIMMSQIQPHFLYNTLSTIQVLCHTDPEKAADVTGQFSEYLRQNLDSLSRPGLIPFWKELEHTRTYAAIEETRFPHIRVRWDIGDGDFSLPPLTLQPMVENAIRHGVRIREDGLVEVSTRREGAFHRLEIRDNGRGFDVGSLETLDGSHIGIRSVRERVERMCGGSLDIRSSPGEGTTVTIRIPAPPAAREGSETP